MLVGLLFIIIAYNLFTVITEESTVFYKDIRFWLVVISLFVLIVVILRQYPA